MINFYFIEGCSKYDVEQASIIHQHSFKAIFEPLFAMWIMHTDNVVLCEGDGLNPSPSRGSTAVDYETRRWEFLGLSCIVFFGHF